MEWLVSNRGTLQGPCSSLGWKEGNIYVPNPDCKGDLEALERELAQEDLVTRNVRRGLGLSRVSQKDLIPILVHVEDKKIVSVAIRLLVNLTMPVECLLPLHVASQTSTGQETIRQLQVLLFNAKKAFLDVQATASIVKTIKDILHAEKSCISVVESDCNDVNNCLLLLRNILHIPDKTEFPSLSRECYLEWQNLQNKLIWNLFAQGLDVTLLLMMNHKHKSFWTISMVQLIALLYNDQHVGKIQNLLSLVPDESESSDDEIESDGSKCSGGNTSSSSSSSFSKNNLSDSGCPQSSDTWGDSSSSNNSRNVPNTRISRTNANNEMDDQDSEQNKSDSVPDNKIHLERRNSTKGPASIRRHSLAETTTDKKIQNGTTNFQRYPRESQMDGESSDNQDSSGFSNGVSSEEDEFTIKSGKQPETNSERRTSTTYNNNLIIMTSSAKNMATKHNRANTKKTNQESDSSNEDDLMQQDTTKTVKLRSHPPVGRKARSIGIGKGLKCSASICFDAAEEAANSKGRTITKEILLEKRKVPRMMAINLTHDPTDEDITNLLKDFTLSFLHNGFAELVTDLKKMILIQNPIILDKSHFLWLLTYFLRLSSTLSLSFHHVKPMLSSDIISYLTYEGVMMCEELELFFQTRQIDIKSLLRRMHLLVTAFREVITTIDCYSKKPISKKEKLLFQQLRCQIADMYDVRQVFLLLIRHYNPTVHCKQYLVDIITTHHMLLLLLEKVASDDEYKSQFDLETHLQQFANAKVMEQFGKIMEDFKTNSEFVNDCVFTMMHHVAGDLKSPQTLFQPTILKSFCKILEDEADTFQTLPVRYKEYWDDLMNYILNKFMKATQRSPQACVRKLFGLMTVNSEKGACTPSFDSSACYSSGDSGSSSASSEIKLNDKEDALYWWYLQFEHDIDPVGRIVESLSEFQTHISRSKVIQELLTQGVITQVDYEGLKAKEKAYNDEKNESFLCNSIKPEPDSVQAYVLELTQAGMKPHVLWLQNVLLEACYVKLGGRSTEDKPLEDPVPYYSIMMNQSIPLVPYSDTQETAVHSDLFVKLLHKLGFHLSSDVGKVYPRIPSFWGADILYSVANELGPINEKNIKFKLSELENRNTKISDDEDMDVNKFNFTDHNKTRRPPLLPVKVQDSWMNIVQKSKIKPITPSTRASFS